MLNVERIFILGSQVEGRVYRMTAQQLDNHFKLYPTAFLIVIY